MTVTTPPAVLGEDLERDAVAEPSPTVSRCFTRPRATGNPIDVAAAYELFNEARQAYRSADFEPYPAAAVPADPQRPTSRRR